MRLLIAATVVTAVTSCGSHATPTGPEPVAVPVHDAGVGPGPTDVECDALIAHAIDLQTPGDAGIGSADRTKLTGEVHDKVLTRCRAMPHAIYRCAMAATTTDALISCDR